MILTVATIKRANTGANGNPAYIIGFTDGNQARTKTDSGWAYEVSDLMIGKTLDFTFGTDGRIRYAKPVHQE